MDAPRGVRLPRVAFDTTETSFSVSRETLIPTVGRAWRWAKRLFASMSKNAVKASEFFQIPTNRVVELGKSVERDVRKSRHSEPLRGRRAICGRRSQPEKLGAAGCSPGGRDTKRADQSRFAAAR